MKLYDSNLQGDLYFEHYTSASSMRIMRLAGSHCILQCDEDCCVEFIIPIRSARRGQGRKDKMAKIPKIFRKTKTIRNLQSYMDFLVVTKDVVCRGSG